MAFPEPPTPTAFAEDGPPLQVLTRSLLPPGSCPWLDKITEFVIPASTLGSIDTPGGEPLSIIKVSGSKVRHVCYQSEPFANIKVKATSFCSDKYESSVEYSGRVLMTSATNFTDQEGGKEKYTAHVTTATGLSVQYLYTDTFSKCFGTSMLQDVSGRPIAEIKRHRNCCLDLNSPLHVKFSQGATSVDKLATIDFLVASSRRFDGNVIYFVLAVLFCMGILMMIITAVKKHRVHVDRHLWNITATSFTTESTLSPSEK